VEQETIPQDVNAASAKGQPKFTQVPPVGHGENVVINKIPSTTQPQVLQILIGEPSSAKVNISEDIQNVLINANKTKDKLEILEESLRVIEGVNACEFGDVARLYLVPDVVIPPKLKVSEFEKYKGATCLKSHLTMYCRKMIAHAHDEKLLMHIFQYSLAGMTLNWYMLLEPARVRSSKNLIDAFLKQYKYNMDMAPDRIQLQNMMKKSSETFKEYAHRWRELTVQVEPPLHEKEMTTMFIETLQTLFYEHVLGSISSNFSNIVTIGEMIEHGLKSGKIAQGSSAATNAKKPGFNPNKKKEGEVQAASATPYWGGINGNIVLITDLHLHMLQMLCRAILRMLLGHQLYFDLHLHLIIHFRIELEVRILIKHKVKAMARREIIREIEL